MLIKAILVGLVAALTALEGGWLGESKFREPLVTGLLVGLIFGDIKNGLIIGAQLQLVWMGVTGIGLVSGLPIGIGGTLGVACALMTNSGVETALAFGLPASVLMQSFGNILIPFKSALMHKADDYADKADTKGMIGVHYFVGLINLVYNFVPSFLAIYFGSAVVQSVINVIPAWFSAGLSGIAALMPALGFAMLMQILMEPKLAPYFAIAFAASAYLGLDMLALTIIGVAIAIIVYMNSTSKQNIAVTAGEDDEL